MIGEHFGHVFDKPLGRLARRIPVSPNVLTVTGFLITVCASIVLVSNVRLGGLLLISGGIFDILDGVVARVQGRATLFGAFLDSYLDRYADGCLLVGLAVSFFRTGNLQGILLCLSALVGAFMVSYARARAEGLGINCKTGIMERPERLVVLAFGTVSGILIPSLWALSVLTHLTALQRLHRVWRASAGG